MINSDQLKKLFKKLFRIDSYKSIFIHICMTYLPSIYLYIIDNKKIDYKTAYITLLKFLKFSFFNNNYLKGKTEFYIEKIFKKLKENAGYLYFFEDQFFQLKDFYEKYNFILKLSKELLIFFGKGNIKPSAYNHCQNKTIYNCKNVHPNDFNEEMIDTLEIFDDWVSTTHGNHPDFVETSKCSQTPVKMFTFQNVFVTAEYYILSKKLNKVKNFQVDLHNNILSEETNGLGDSRKLISSDSHSLFLEINKLSKNCISYPEAILLSGKSSTNYFHWIIEYLNKAMLMDKLPHLKDIPLIVDAQMPFQHYEALKKVFNFENQKIIFFCPKRSIINVNKLYVPQVPCYLSDKFSENGLERVSFAKNHLIYLKNKIIKNTSNLSEDKRKIYITRKKRNRSIINEDQIIRILKQYKFEIYDTAELSFEDQVRLFYSADVVIGAAGAALTNILFCRENTRVCVLNSSFHQDNCLFSTLSSILGLNFESLFGKPYYTPYNLRFAFSNAFYDHYFSPFFIDKSNFKGYLESLRG